jgi:hypothetical protein
MVSVCVWAMTWYTGMCGIMTMGLLYKLVLWLVCECRGFESNGFVTNDVAILNGWSL